MLKKIVYETIRDAVLLSYRKASHKSETSVLGRELAPGEILCSTTRNSSLTKTNLNDALKVLWNREDKVKLFSAECPEGQELGISELSEDCTAAIFSSETTVYGSPRYAIYPSSAVKSFDASKGEAVIDLSEAMSSPLCTSLEKDEALSEETAVSALPMAAKSEGSLFSFRNLFGAINIRVYDYARYGFEVALLDSEGEVLWSFHIWVGEVSDVECSSDKDGSFAIMDRNLGATAASAPKRRCATRSGSSTSGDARTRSRERSRQQQEARAETSL